MVKVEHQYTGTQIRKVLRTAIRELSVAEVETTLKAMIDELVKTRQYIVLRALVRKEDVRQEREDRRQHSPATHYSKARHD